MESSIDLKARQEWDERYADLVLGKRNWQITDAGMMAITLVLAFGMVWVSTRSKFVPYVVEVDKLGYARCELRYELRIRFEQSPPTVDGSAIAAPNSSRHSRRSSRVKSARKIAVNAATAVTGSRGGSSRIFRPRVASDSVSRLTTASSSSDLDGK